MIETAFKQFVKNDIFRLIFLVLVGLFISETGFAQKHRIRGLVRVTWTDKKNTILIATGVYDYSYGPKSEHAYLENCEIEASVDNIIYFKLMVIQTPQQKFKNITKIIFKNKLNKALIVFTNTYHAQEQGLVWPDSLSQFMKVEFPNYGNLSAVVLKWDLGSEFRDVRYIRVSGIWQIGRRNAEVISEFYDLYKLNQNALKTNTPDTITIEPEKNRLIY